MFLAVNNFFGAISKVPNKITFVCVLFLKLNQRQNTKTKIFLGFFFKNHIVAHFLG